MSNTRTIRLRCGLCEGKKRLWLRGGDYVECPDCEATGLIEAVETKVQAKVKQMFIPKKGGGLLSVHRTLIPNIGWRDAHGTV